MVPFRFSFETEYTPTQAFDELEKVTKPEPDSMWRQIRLEFKIDPFEGKVFAGHIDRANSRFKVFNYLRGPMDRSFSVYVGRVESIAGRTQIRVWWTPSATFNVFGLLAIIAVVIGSLRHPDQSPNPLVMFPVLVLLVSVIVIPIQLLNRRKAKILFMGILQPSRKGAYRTSLWGEERD